MSDSTKQVLARAKTAMLQAPSRIHPRRTGKLDSLEDQGEHGYYPLTIPGPNGSTVTIDVTHRYSGQHTLEWPEVRFGSDRGGPPALPGGLPHHCCCGGWPYCGCGCGCGDWGGAHICGFQPAPSLRIPPAGAVAGGGPG